LNKTGEGFAMVRSMTGFGRTEHESEQFRITCEMKSVNSRYFEFSVRVPRSCGFLEDRLKKLANTQVTRGKVECYVGVEFLGESHVEVALNEVLLAGYQAAIEAMQTNHGIANDITATSLLRVPDLLTVQKKTVDEEEIWAAVEAVAAQTLAKFIAMRELEGQRLRDDILARADEILSHVSFIEQRAPELTAQYMEKLRTKMQALLETTTIEEQRLLTEAAIFAEKTAVDEETVRLRSHMDQLRDMLAGDAAVGRKLDFLVQEINRECNTIGSKIGDVDITRRVVDMKSCVEKIREQVQNIE